MLIQIDKRAAFRTAQGQNLIPTPPVRECQFVDFPPQAAPFANDRLEQKLLDAEALLLMRTALWTAGVEIHIEKRSKPLQSLFQFDHVLRSSFRPAR